MLAAQNSEAKANECIYIYKKNSTIDVRNIQMVANVLSLHDNKRKSRRFLFFFCRFAFFEFRKELHRNRKKERNRMGEKERKKKNEPHCSLLEHCAFDSSYVICSGKMKEMMIYGSTNDNNLVIY